MPKMIEVDGRGRFAQNAAGYWTNDDWSACCIQALRTVGDVTEVLDDEAGTR